MSEPPRRGRQSADQSATTPDYEVGYGRPPRATQFKPGQCGNPKGRPRKPKSLAHSVDRELDRLVTVRESGREKRLSKREVISRRLVDDACRGDARAVRLVRDLNKAPAASDQLASSHAEPLVPLPLDGTDRAIIAAFVALIRSGAELPGADPDLGSEDPDWDGDGLHPAPQPSPARLH